MNLSRLAGCDSKSGYDQIFVRWLDELAAALLVNPHDIDGMARALALAVAMPLGERRERWEAMMAKLRRYGIQQWSDGFVAALENIQSAGIASVPLV